MNAVRATFEDVRRVKTRKVWQLIFEVPEEAYDDAIEKLGGSPRSGTDTWVGIARLTEGNKTEQPAERKHRSWDEVSPREQACIRCNEPQFRDWLAEFMQLEPLGLPAVEMLYQYLGIKSRKEIVAGSEVAKWWDSLDQEYQDHIGEKRYQTQLEDGPS